MLRHPDIDHIVRAAASLSGHLRFVMMGSGAVIATARRLPAVMMATKEIDIYSEEAEDTAFVSDLIDGAIRRDSQFHKTFRYYGDGVGPSTAVMRLDWRSRAMEKVTPDGARPPKVWHSGSPSRATARRPRTPTAPAAGT